MEDMRFPNLPLSTPRSNPSPSSSWTPKSRQTSASQLGRQRQGAATSVFRRQAGAAAISETRQEQEVRDQQRYVYVRKLVKQRLLKEKEEAAKEKTESPYKFKVGAGAQATRKVLLDKQIRQRVLKHRSVYSNVSPEDRKFLSNFLIKHAAKKPTGGRYGFSQRRKMKSELFEARLQGKISREDEGDFKKVVDQLE